MLQQQTYKKYLQHSFTLHHWLIASCSFGVLLLCTRVVATGYTTYVFLLWNLFLAFIPYAISNWLHNSQKVVKNKVKLIALISLWLVFIPNSFYILTDLFHLDQFTSAPKWFDLLLLLSFGLNGLLFGIVSLRKMELMLQKASGRGFSMAVVFLVMWLNAYGIYIGRYLRYNSWDVVTQPFSLLNELLAMLVHPFHNRMEWGMIFCYAVFMTLLYVTLKKMSTNFN